MKDTQNITIVLLIVTAAILAGVLVVSLNSRDADAACASVKGGDYIVVTGAFNKTKDLVYVIDIGTQRMNVYGTDLRKNSIELYDAIELNKLFKNK